MMQQSTMPRQISPSPLATRVRQWVTHPNVLAVLVLSLLWVLFFWRLLTPVKEDRVLFLDGDFTLQFFAASDYQVGRLWQGEIPLWNPYINAGAPMAADLQWGTWYPARWIAALLAGPGGWRIEALQLEVAAQYWLASMMLFAFLRALVHHPFAALVGSITFTYGGYLVGYPMLDLSILESVIWLPLALLGTHLSTSKTSWKVGGIALAGIALGLSFLAGHPQTTLFALYLTLAYLVFTGRGHGLSWPGIGWRAILLIGIGAGIGAIQLLPAWEFTRLSDRVAALHYAEKSHGHAVEDLLQLIWPGVSGGWWSPFYVGVAGFILAIGALPRRRAAHLFWGGVLAVGLLASLGSKSIVYDFLYVFVPAVGLFRQQEHFALLASFALTMLATGQMDWLLDRPAPEITDEHRFRWLAGGHLLVTGLAAVAITLYSLAQTEVVFSQATSTLLLIALFSALFIGWYYLQRGGSRIAEVALAALIVADLFTFGTRSVNFVPDTPEHRRRPLEASYLQAPNQITWHVDGAAGLIGYGTYYRVPDIYGSSPLTLDSIAELRRIPVDRFWEVLAVRYVTLSDVAPPASVPVSPLGTFQSPLGQSYVLYELRDPRPFAHLVYDSRAAGSPEFARLIMADARVNLREMAVTIQALPFDLPGARPGESSVTGFRMVTPEQLEMTVSTGENALLTLAVPNYPGWQATVNGRRVEIVDTYAGLIGIPIRAGDNQNVRVEFIPPTVIIGGAISVAALLAVLTAVLVTCIVRRRSRQIAPSEESSRCG